MQMPGQCCEVYGPSNPPRPRDYLNAACFSTSKPVTGKSFTIDALLSRPDHAETDRSSLYRNLTQISVPTTPVPFPGQVYSQMPQFMYNHGVVQAGYPVFCYPAYNYQSTCRGALYGQDEVLVKAGVHFKHKVGKSKRMRTSFTNEQLSRLEKEFARQQYMVGSERFLLASALQLTEAQVKVWFQNRRIKWRKQSLEQQQAKLAKLGLAVQPKSPGSQGREDEERDFTEDSDVDIDIDDSLQE